MQRHFVIWNIIPIHPIYYMRMKINVLFHQAGKSFDSTCPPQSFSLSKTFFNWLCSLFRRVWVGRIFNLVKLILFLKTFFWGGVASSSLTVEPLLITPSRQSWPGKWYEHNSNWFDKLKNSTESDITLYSTLFPFTSSQVVHKTVYSRN